MAVIRRSCRMPHSRRSGHRRTAQRLAAVVAAPRLGCPLRRIPPDRLTVSKGPNTPLTPPSNGSSRAGSVYGGDERAISLATGFLTGESTRKPPAATLEIILRDNRRLRRILSWPRWILLFQSRIHLSQFEEATREGSHKAKPPHSAGLKGLGRTC